MNIHVNSEAHSSEMAPYLYAQIINIWRNIFVQSIQ